MIPLPLAFVAQESGQLQQIARAKRGKFKSVALQSRNATDDSIKAFKDAGFTVMEWDRVDANTKKHAGSVQLNLQIEETSELNNVIDFLPKLQGQVFSIGTTYGGLDTADGSAWRRLTAACMSHGASIESVWVECYHADDPIHADVSRMLNQGVAYGIPASLLLPLIGTYRSEMPATYTGLLDRAPNFGIYILEETTDAQLDAFAALASAQVPSPVLVDPAECNRNISKEAHRWLDQFAAGSKPHSRLAVIDRIARSTDAQWVAARDHISDALGDAGA